MLCRAFPHCSTCQLQSTLFLSANFTNVEQHCFILTTSYHTRSQHSTYGYKRLANTAVPCRLKTHSQHFSRIMSSSCTSARRMQNIPATMAQSVTGGSQKVLNTCCEMYVRMLSYPPLSTSLCTWPTIQRKPEFHRYKPQYPSRKKGRANNSRV